MATLSVITLIFFLFFCAVTDILSKNVDKKEKENNHTQVIFDKRHREEKVLINGINRPYQLSYYKNGTGHILFFSYNVGRQNESTFEIGYAENGYKVPVPVTEVKNGFATAMNHKEDLIYLGGSEGVYFRYLNGTANHTHLLIPDHDIWDLFYKDSLYFISFPSRRLYKHHSGHHSERQDHIHEKIFNFVIDGDGDTFINNKTGLYMIRSGSKHRIHMKGPKVFRAFEVNRKGVAHFCGQNEVYIADKEHHRLEEIAKIKNIFGLTFDDDDNVIFSDPHQIIRLELIQKASKVSNGIKKINNK